MQHCLIVTCLLLAAMTPVSFSAVETDSSAQEENIIIEDDSAPPKSMENSSNSPVVHELASRPKDEITVDECSRKARGTREELYEHERIDPAEYGGRATIGIAVGGGGIIGIPLRIFMTERVAFELAAFFRPVLILNYGEFHAGTMFTGGLDCYFTKRAIASRSRVSMNGMFVKGGYGFCHYVNSTMLAMGWAHEGFHKYNKGYSFSLELGPGILINDRSSYIYDHKRIQPALYWKLHWGWAFSSGF